MVARHEDTSANDRTKKFDSGWRIKDSKGNVRAVEVTDETERDGGQGEHARSSLALFNHIVDTHQWFDRMTIGWPYVNLADAELARYLRENLSKISEKDGYSDLTKDKFLVYTLMHRGKESTPDDVNPASPFGMMLRDMHAGTQPYGTVNVLTKARVADLKDFGEQTTSESHNTDMAHTMHLLKEANPSIRLEIAIEHLYTAWLEEDNRAANRKHIADTIVTGLLNGAERVMFPDTDGAHKPREIKAVIRAVTRALENDNRLLEAGIKFTPEMIKVHTHEDRGFAPLNTEAGLQMGAGACDLNVGRAGERQGNITLGGLANVLGHKDRAKMIQYENKFDMDHGGRLGDKPIGGQDAYVATGGMHGDHLWKAFLAKHEETNISFNDFVKDFRGSYATVFPGDYGGALHVALSPVSGAANVLCVLASMGTVIKDKKDLRIGEVIAEIKRGEHEDGINYRGVNNANALLLLADKFGLRECKDEEGQPAGRNNLKILPHINERPMWGTELSNVTLSAQKINSEELLKLTIPVRLATTKGIGGDLKAANHAHDLVQEIINELPPAFKDITLEEARCYETHVGELSAKQGDVLKPSQQKKQVVNLRFTTGPGSEYFQAYGAGDTYEAALVNAVSTMIDYQCLHIETQLKERGESSRLSTRILEQKISQKESLRQDYGLGFTG
jgi:hypothetical protein